MDADGYRDCVPCIRAYCLGGPKMLECACRRKRQRRCRLPSMPPAECTNKISKYRLNVFGRDYQRRQRAQRRRNAASTEGLFPAEYTLKINDRPALHLRLKVQTQKAEVTGTLLCGCVVWSPNRDDSNRVRQIHHSMLLRFTRWWELKREEHTI